MAKKKKTTDDSNREGWLRRAIVAMTGLLEDAGGNVPEMHVSVGFPKGQRGRQRAIGQCWSEAMAEDGVSSIFICPTLDDPVEVLATLLHEMVHATVGVDCGHKGPFVKMIREVGLEGKATATVPGAALRESLLTIAGKLGEYPHAAMKVPPKKKVGSTLKLWECACEVPQKVRIGRSEFHAICTECEMPFILRSA